VFSAVTDCTQDLKVPTDERCFVATEHGPYLMRHHYSN
jgi:hypothetical protein